MPLFSTRHAGASAAALPSYIEQEECNFPLVVLDYKPPEAKGPIEALPTFLNFLNFLNF